jgi:hypothetical protein
MDWEWAAVVLVRCVAVFSLRPDTHVAAQPNPSVSRLTPRETALKRVISGADEVF